MGETEGFAKKKFFSIFENMVLTIAISPFIAEIIVKTTEFS